MKTIKATEYLVIKIQGPGEVDRPLIHIKATDADQIVVVYSEEIRHLIAALTEAMGELVTMWVDDRREHTWP